MRSRSITLAFLATAITAAPAAADELTDRLEALPGFTVVEERPHPLAGHRLFVLSYEQQVNHFMPWKGTFAQRLALIHRDENLPMVLVTDGYDVSLGTARAQVTQVVGGNQVRVEHRFFEPSRPDPADWRDLDIFQAASDHHRIVSALKTIYVGRWLNTGASKSGMAAVYHRRFYRGDVAGTVAYVAPNDVIDRHDEYVEFLDEVADDPACTAALEELQRQALLRRDEIVPVIEELAGLIGFTFDVFQGADRAWEILVLETPFTFWQLGAQFFCDFVPPPEASTDEILGFIDAVVGVFNYTDQILGGFYVPYFYQAATQLGYPTVGDDHLEDVLRYPGADVARSFVPAEIEVPHHQQLAMVDVDVWVRISGSELMFIYGEIDPWGAERFRLGPGTRDSYVYEAAGANHGANLNQLTPDERAEAVATIQRWAGLPAFRTVAPLLTAEVEGEAQRREVRPRL